MMIRPNCRAQFAAEDIDFILSVLGRKISTAECLVKLLADEDSRDLILDDEALLHALLERSGCLRVSSRFYFYILVRQVLRRSGIQDRAVADYVAEVLAEFTGFQPVLLLNPSPTGVASFGHSGPRRSGLRGRGACGVFPRGTGEMRGPRPG